MKRKARAPPGKAARVAGTLRRAAMVAVCVLCTAMFAAPVVLAAPPAPAGTFDGSATPATSFSGPWRVAVDEATGDVYVMDVDNDVVDRFSSTGTYLSQIRGSDTAATSFGFASNIANDIAVDNSAGGQGDVYVAAFNSQTVFKLDSTGSEVWEAAGAGGQCGLGVDPDGNPWVVDFTSTDLTQLRADDGGATGTTFALQSSLRCHLAFDNDGAAYVTGLTGNTDAFEKYDGRGGIIAIDPSPVATWAVATSFRRNDIFSVASDAGTPVIRQWDKNGSKISEITGTAGANSYESVAVDGVRNRLYVADIPAGVVRVYTIPAQPPAVIGRSATNITTTSATLHATVNPNGSDITDCHAEWVTDAQFRSTGFTGARTASCSPVVPISGTDDVDVTALATGLTPRTTYHTRFVATNGSTTNGDDVLVATRTPPVPTLRAGVASNLTQTGATLAGTANPNGDTTTCKFQYGTTLSYGAEVVTASPGSGSGDVAVNANVTGLTAGTLYHFRLACTNGGGTSNGADVAFTTQPAPTCATDASLCPPPPPPPARTCATDASLCRVTLEVVSGLRVTCTGDTGGACRSTLTFRAKVRYKVKRGRRTVNKTRTITVGRATVDLAVGGSTALRISLTSAAKSALKKSALSATAVGLDGAVKLPKTKARRPKHRRK